MAAGKRVMEAQRALGGESPHRKGMMPFPFIPVPLTHHGQIDSGAGRDDGGA